MTTIRRVNIRKELRKGEDEENTYKLTLDMKTHRVIKDETISSFIVP